MTVRPSTTEPEIEIGVGPVREGLAFGGGRRSGRFREGSWPNITTTEGEAAGQPRDPSRYG